MSLSGRIAGEMPYLRIWHLDWLSIKDLNPALHRLLPNLKGSLLDVGCGQKPYEVWCTGLASYVGIDVSDSTKADFVVVRGERWPFDDASFDNVFTSQALEHVMDFEHVLAEMHRVLRPGGKLLVSVPFYHNEHGVPDDYRRFTADGMRLMFGDDCEVEQVLKLGAVGSVLGVARLNWMSAAMDRAKWSRRMRTNLWPLWFLICGICGLWAAFVDKLDVTGAFYTNVLMVATKR